MNYTQQENDAMKRLSDLEKEVNSLADAFYSVMRVLEVHGLVETDYRITVNVDGNYSRWVSTKGDLYSRGIVHTPEKVSDNNGE